MKKITLALLVTIAVYHASASEIYTYDTHPSMSMNTKAAIPQELEKNHWLSKGQSYLKEHLERSEIKKVAKNVIFFIGDGMSLATVAAARTLEGQMRGETGEENKLAFEKFPAIGLSHTYCVDVQVADSACSATAYLGGVKGNDATIGVSGKVKTKDCAAMNDPNNQVKSVLHHAADAGKSTGIVTTTRITHASPSGAHAHIAHRNWEADVDILADNGNTTICKDIAHQLIKKAPGSNFEVIMGGGRLNFLPEGNGGRRKDGLNLINEWKADHTAKGDKPEYLENKQDMLAIKNDTTHILGLFNGDHLDYHLLANKDDQPTLEEMTETAIKVLSKNKNGFFLFVEGGRIDHAHHKTMAHIALDETIEMSKAVQKAIDLTNEDETLIVVSSDHSHAMTISGYPTRGNPILGASNVWQGLDDIDYLTLSYANGPGYRQYNNSVRPDVTKEEGFIKNNPEFMFPAMVPLTDETHGGEDVAVFAKGPFQHLFVGSYEQNLIPHIMAYASCIGPGEQYCNSARAGNGSSVVVLSGLLFSLILSHIFKTHYL